VSVEIKIPKKLIEVALPLDDINVEAAREKSIRQGHPSTVHLWWARRPLAAARAVLFSQLVNDPGYERSLGRGVNKEKAQAERERLFNIIRELVKWDNSNNDQVLRDAKAEIIKSWKETCKLNEEHPLASELFNPNELPPFIDPFAGGGAIPLEAYRLGLNSTGTDLNPVAVLLNKSLIEIPSTLARSGVLKFTHARGTALELSVQKNLSTDVDYYGEEILKRVRQKIGRIFGKIKVTKEIIDQNKHLQLTLGQELDVISWIWARTVKSPNPKFSSQQVPLVSSFNLCKKDSKKIWINYKIENGNYSFYISGKSESPLESTISRSGGICLFSEVPIPFSYIREEGRAGRIGKKLLSIICDGPRGRLYLNPTLDIENGILDLPDFDDSFLNIKLPNNPRDFKTPNYGLETFSSLFTDRQKLGLILLSDEINAVKEEIKSSILEKMRLTSVVSAELESDATSYANAIATYLTLAVGKSVDYNSSVCGWISGGETIRNTFGRQAIPMVWDYCEANLLGESTGSYRSALNQITKVIERLPLGLSGQALQVKAQTTNFKNRIISTDPPYYDNISYADLSDFFYLWLRRTLLSIYPEIFNTLQVPKLEELVASPYRHNGVDNAEKFFLEGMKEVFGNAISNSHPAFPITIYYAFKQSETETTEGTSSTGWETFLEALISSGLSITGTWPMRTELGNRIIGSGTNVLASSIVLVCRKRQKGAGTISRREFIRELNFILPQAIEELANGDGNSIVAPVDMSQAIIGPGMAVYSKYDAVIEADGNRMSVKTALQLINRYISEDDFDVDTQFCLNWFETNGWSEGLFGQADVLARAKGTSVEGLRDGGVAKSSAGKFSLIKWPHLSEEWSPETDIRSSHWEMLHYLIRAYNKNGESNAGEILARIHSKSETIRALAYRLYTVCERKKYAEDAANYNNLILAWEAIEMAAQSVGVKDTQPSLFETEPEAQETTKKTKRKK
jgi:putative DNA methylase